MKKLRLFSLMVSLLATAVTFSACSDDDDDVNTTAPAPTVTLTQGEVTAESIAFTLTPANAVEARWLCLEESGAGSVTADQVLANGKEAAADQASNLVADELKGETAYVIYAAAKNVDGLKVLSEPLKATTLKAPVAAPTVTLALGEVTAETIAFTLTPANAVKARWICIEEGSREVTAELLLANGTSAAADKASELVAEALMEDTAYEIYAAVENEEGVQVLSEPLKAKTAKGDGPDEPDPVLFEGLEASAELLANEAGDGYNVWKLSMKADGTNSLCVKLWVSAEDDKNYLPEGEFDPQSETNVGKLMTGENTHITIDGVVYQPASGYLAVLPDLETEPGKVNYMIEGELNVTRDFTTFMPVSIIYEGPIEGCKVPGSDTPVEEAIEYPMTQGELMNTPDPGVFQVRFVDGPAWNYSAGLRFKAAADAVNLPAGHYSLADGTIIGESNSYLTTDYSTQYETPGYARDWKSCEADITLEGKVYTMDMTIEANDGKKYHVTFTGEIKDMPFPTAEPTEIRLTYALFWDKPEPGVFHVKVDDRDAWKHEGGFRFKAAADAVNLPAGHYSMADGTIYGESISSLGGTSGSGYARDWKSCEADITLEGKVYNIDMNIEGNDGAKFHVTFNGEIADMPFPTAEPTEIRLTHAELWDKPEPGVFHVKVDDRDAWKHEGGFRFKAAADATYLTSGHYSMADGTIYGESISSLGGTSGSGYARDWKSCEADIALEDGIYYIDMDIEGNDGQLFHVTFEGEIAGMTLPQTITIMQPPYIQVDINGEPGKYEGVLAMCDNKNPMAGFGAFVSLWIHSETEYLYGEYPFMTVDEAEAAGVKNYIENDPDNSSYMVAGADGPIPGVIKNLFFGAQSGMPAKDDNMITIQLEGMDGTVIQAMYQGPLYGGGQPDVPTEPTAFPLDRFNSATVLQAGGPYATIEFATASGPLTLSFIGSMETFEFVAGGYDYCSSEDMTDDTQMVFQGGFVRYGIGPDEEDTTFTIVSGRIGVVKPSEMNGNKWTFQLLNVYAKADNGETIILGNLQPDGENYMCTPSIDAAKLDLSQSAGPGPLRR